MAASLDGCKAKLRRASRHLQEIERCITLASHNPYTVQTEYDTESGKWVYRFKNVTHLPIDLSVVIGDFAHNVRSSLDHLVYQLVELAGGDHSVKSEFPIFLDPKRFTSEGLWKLRQVPDAYRTKIIEFQPYDARRKGNADPLWLLSELNIVDKHRTLDLGVIAVVKRTAILTYPQMPRELARWDIDKVEGKTVIAVEEGAVFMRIAGYPPEINPENYMKFEHTHNVHFRGGSKDIIGRQVLFTLRLVREYVHYDVFPEFEPAFV